MLQSAQYYKKFTEATIQEKLEQKQKEIANQLEILDKACRTQSAAGKFTCTIYNRLHQEVLDQARNLGFVIQNNARGPRSDDPEWVFYWDQPTKPEQEA